jgi:hypothetical protein
MTLWLALGRVLVAPSISGFSLIWAKTVETMRLEMMKSSTHAWVLGPRVRERFELFFQMERWSRSR